MLQALLPHAFVVLTAALASTTDWALRWIISGAPALTFAWLAGSANGYRVLPFLSSWTLIATLNLFYAVAATSWLLYWCFAAACYPAILVSCLFQFTFAGNAARKLSRSLLKHMHFVDDKIGIFDIPALEIDTEVDGLMVIRGITVSLSTLTIVAHGVEVGIKLSDDLELALQTNDVTISLLRKIEVGHVYGSIKGGLYEMTFGDVAKPTREEQQNKAFMVTDSPLIRAAGGFQAKMTNGAAPKPESPGEGLKATTRISLVDQQASDRYQAKLDFINQSSAINQCRNSVAASWTDAGDLTDGNTTSDPLAAICSQLQSRPSVPHPPSRSIRVTSLQTLLPLYIRRFLHRLPMLYRLLLNPLSYFHPVTIASITTSASGAWAKTMVDHRVFKETPEDSKDTKNIRQRISSWLANSNFTLCLMGISAWAHVPFLTEYNITNRLLINEIIAHRILPSETHLEQVVQLGGADATIEVPSFLFPHHEHLFPPEPTETSRKEQTNAVEDAKSNGYPKEVQAAQELQQHLADEATMKISVHAHLPLVMNKDLLSVTVALATASKIVEIEKNPSPMDAEIHGFREFSQAVRSSVKESMGKAAVETIADDKVITKILGKIAKKLETAQGDVGYSGDVPIPLKPYRDNAEAGSKILP